MRSAVQSVVPSKPVKSSGFPITVRKRATQLARARTSRRRICAIRRSSAITDALGSHERTETPDQVLRDTLDAIGREVG
jgi:hypothetical protein